MITTDLDRFLALARACAPDFGPATARAAFLVTPEGFARAEESAQDNRYMAAAGYHAEAALAVSALPGCPLLGGAGMARPDQLGRVAELGAPWESLNNTR